MAKMILPLPVTPWRRAFMPRIRPHCCHARVRCWIGGQRPVTAFASTPASPQEARSAFTTIPYWPRSSPMGRIAKARAKISPKPSPTRDCLVPLPTRLIYWRYWSCPISSRASRPRPWRPRLRCRQHQAKRPWLRRRLLFFTILLRENPIHGAAPVKRAGPCSCARARVSIR